jgi:hypothetical protein
LVDTHQQQLDGYGSLVTTTPTVNVYAERALRVLDDDQFDCLAADFLSRQVRGTRTGPSL